MRVSVQTLAAAEPVVEEIGTQINLLDEQGAQYAQHYFEHILTGAPRPRAPQGMHSLLVKAIRDLVLDEATVVRMHGHRRVVGAHA